MPVTNTAVTLNPTLSGKCIVEVYFDSPCTVFIKAQLHIINELKVAFIFLRERCITDLKDLYYRKLDNTNNQYTYTQPPIQPTAV